LIRKLQLDTISKKSSGLALLDKINAQEAKSDTIGGTSIEDFPLFKVFSPNTKIGKDGISYIDSSSIIGMPLDTLQLLKYLDQSKALFPNDLKWKIAGKLSGNFKCLHAIKSKGEKLQLFDSDIDSVVVQPIGLTALGFVGKKISDLQGISKFWIHIKLKKELSDRLKNKNFTLLLNSGSYEYSGSIVNFMSYPNQLIIIGEMDNNDFQIMKEKFEKRMIIKN
jgi:hypothetical protein